MATSGVDIGKKWRENSGRKAEKEAWNTITVERALKRWLIVRMQGYRWYIVITQAQETRTWR
jgi:hypothetical protein